MTHHSESIIGTISGTLLVVFTLPLQNILTTVILAIIGATTGFCTTLLLKYLYKKFTTK
jgi:hypothetical protein